MARKRQADSSSALIAAAKNKDLAEIQRLLAAGEDPNCTGIYGVTPLLTALGEQHVEAACVLLEHGASASLFVQGYNSIASATATLPPQTDQRLFALLVAGGFQPHERGSDKTSPLCYAVRAGNIPWAKFLVENGAEVNAYHQGDPWALDDAIQFGQTAMVHFLLDQGADVSLADGQAIIHAAEKNCTEELLNILLAAIPRAAQRRQCATQALLQATESGHCSLLPMLLEAGANPNTFAPIGANSLLWALLKRHYDCVPLLLTAGAKVNRPSPANAKWWQRLKPLYVPLGLCNHDPYLYDRSAPDRSRDMELAQLLLEAGATIDAQAVHLACTQGLKWVKILGRDKANFNARDTQGATPLMRAVEADQTDVIKYFITCKVNINAQDKQGATALIRAAGRQFGPIVTLLLQAGADLTLRTKTGVDALMAATGHKEPSLSLLQTLISAGAPCDRTYNGQTLLDIAADHGAVKLCQFFIKASGQSGKAEAELLNGAKLLVAAKQGALSKVKALLQLPVPQRHKNEALHGALIELARCQRLQLDKALSEACIALIELLLAHGAQPVLHSPPPDKPYPLIYEAMETGQSKVVKLFLSAGALEVPNAPSLSELIEEASQQGKKAVVRTLEAYRKKTMNAE